MFCEAPVYVTQPKTPNSRSDHLKPLVLEAIEALGGLVSGNSQSEIAQALQPRVGGAARRRINSALYKLVTDRVLACNTHRTGSCDGLEPFTRTYRFV